MDVFFCSAVSICFTFLLMGVAYHPLGCFIFIMLHHLFGDWHLVYLTILKCFVSNKRSFIYHTLIYHLNVWTVDTCTIKVHHCSWNISICQNMLRYMATSIWWLSLRITDIMCIRRIASELVLPCNFFTDCCSAIYIRTKLRKMQICLDMSVLNPTVVLKSRKSKEINREYKTSR